MEIDKETLENACFCTKNKSCLDDLKEACPVVADITDELIFVSKKRSAECGYYVNFGYGGFCNCPVRKEIRRKYNK